MAVHILPFRQGTTDEYFEAPYEEHPITICGQTVILTNGELAAALLSLPEQNREIIFLYSFGIYIQQEIGKMRGRCRSTPPNLLPYETIVRATSGEPEAVNESALLLPSGF